MKKTIPVLTTLLFTSFISCSRVTAQNLDSIFNLKDYHRVIAITKFYKRALLNGETEKAEMFKKTINEKGTDEERSASEKMERSAPFMKHKDPQKEIDINDEYLKTFALTKNRFLVAECYFTKAIRYRELKQHNKELENFIYCYDELQKDPAGEYYNQAWWLHLIAACYYEFKDYEKAIEILKKSLPISNAYTPNSKWFAVANPNLLGAAYLKKQQYDSAKLWFTKTYVQAVATGNVAWLGISGGNIGNTYYLQKKYKNAISFYKPAIDTCIKEKIWDNVAPFCSNLADCYIHTGNTSEASAYLQQSKQANELAWKNENWSKYYTVASTYYKLTGNTSQAFQYEDSAKLYDEKLSKEYDIAKKVRTEANWAYSKTTLEAEVALEKAKRERWLLYSIIAVTALLSIIGVLYYKRQKLGYLLKQKHLETEKRRAEENLHMAQTQLQDFTENLRLKNELIEKFSSEIEKLQQFNSTISDEQVASMEALKQSAILTDADWKNFKTLFDKVHPGYISRLKNRHADLTPAETRYVLLEKLELSAKEMAGMLGVSAEAIRNIRFRVKKKLQLEDLKELDAIS